MDTDVILNLTMMILTMVMIMMIRRIMMILMMMMTMVTCVVSPLHDTLRASQSIGKLYLVVELCDL